MEPLPYRVVAVRHDGPEVATVSIRPVDPRHRIAEPTAGQFVMVWAFGVGEVPISVSGIDRDTWAEDASIELTVRIAGAISRAIVHSQPGETLGLRGPFGTAWPIEDAVGADVLVMAGGLGLAPLRLGIEHLLSADPGPRSVTVLIGARHPDQLLFADDQARWRAGGATVLTTVDEPDPTWTGSIGTITELLDEADVHGQIGFVCGPEMMMLASGRALVDRGVAPDQVHLALERNMHCGIAKCGRCQLGPFLLCRDGSIVRWDQAVELMSVGGR